MQFKQHKWVYIIAIVALVVLAVVGGLRHHQKKVTEESTAKATEFVDQLQKAGFPIVNRDRAIQRAAEAFGTDGGELLTDPQSSYYHALANFQLAGSGALSRPGILDDDIFVAEWIALNVYRGPQAAAEFKDWYSGMKFADVTAQ
jgi:hypothetical protein